MQTEIDRLVPLAQNQIPLAMQAADASELETTQLALAKALIENEGLKEQLRCSNARVGRNTRNSSMASGSSRSPGALATSPTPPAGSRESSHQPSSGGSSPVGEVMAGLGRGLPGRLAAP